LGRAHGFAVVVVTLLLMGSTAAAQQQPGPVEELPRDRPVERELAKGERHVYRMDLEAGQFIRVLVEPPASMIEAALTAPDGRLASAYHADLRPKPLASVTDVAGEYHIAVTPTSDGESPGRYRIRITELRPAAPPDGPRALAEQAVAAGVQSYQQHTAESIKAAIDRLEEALPQ